MRHGCAARDAVVRDCAVAAHDQEKEGGVMVVARTTGKRGGRGLGC